MQELAAVFFRRNNKKWYIFGKIFVMFTLVTFKVRWQDEMKGGAPTPGE